MQSKDFIDTYCTSELRGLSPLLKSWCQCVIRYSKIQEWEDNLWWYNERATLSSLAGAAWQLDGWVALEEYSTRKKGRLPTKKGIDSGRLIGGRCDLYVSHQSTSFAIEAKQAWQNIGNRAHANRVDEAMNLAWNDCGHLHRTEADIRLAVVFAVPYISITEVTGDDGKSIDYGKVDSKVNNWIKKCASACDAYAACFPRRIGMFVSKRGYIYPGILLMVRARYRGVSDH